jgi:hypothetical protein
MLTSKGPLQTIHLNPRRSDSYVEPCDKDLPGKLLKSVLYAVMQLKLGKKAIYMVDMYAFSPYFNAQQPPR